MVDLSGLEQTALGYVTRFHNFAQNIETAHLGKLYTTAIDHLDYYVIECAAKPALKNAPEWVSHNKVVNALQTHKNLSILSSAAAAVILYIYLVVILHPKGTASKAATTEKNPKSSDDEMELSDLLEKSDESLRAASQVPLPNKTPKGSDDEMELGDLLEKSYENPGAVPVPSSSSPAPEGAALISLPESASDEKSDPAPSTTPAPHVHFKEDEVAVISSDTDGTKSIKKDETKADLIVLAKSPETAHPDVSADPVPLLSPPPASTTIDLPPPPTSPAPMPPTAVVKDKPE